MATLLSISTLYCFSSIQLSLSGNICLTYPLLRNLFKSVKITDFNTIRVIPFCENGGKWSILKFLAMTKRYGFNIETKMARII
jgi:hypothetical protein